METTVTAYLTSEQLLLFVFELQDSLLPSSTGIITAVQRQAEVTDYLKPKQLLLFVFELQDYILPSSTGILTAVQRQTAVTDYLTSKQLQLFISAGKIWFKLAYITEQRPLSCLVTIDQTEQWPL